MPTPEMTPAAKVIHARDMIELALSHAQESKTPTDWNGKRITEILEYLFLVLQDEPEIAPAPWREHVCI